MQNTTHPVPSCVRDLRAGDIIQAHGLTMVLDADPILSKVHRGGDTYYVHAPVVHRADDTVPLGWMRRDADGTYRFPIQGNTFAGDHPFHFVGRV